MSKKFFGLGKGLGSLIPDKKEAKVTPEQKGESIFYIETNKIRPNSQQPRSDFSKEGLQGLADSIKKYGILQPLLVTKTERPSKQGLGVEYNILAGERRWRAAQIARLPTVPVMIKDSIDEDRVKLEIALIENLQREDLNPLEEAVAYRRFAKDFGLSQKEIAQKVSKSREVVANALRLLDLPPDMQESLRAGKLSRTQARTLLAFKDTTRQKEIYRQIMGGKLSVREVEKKAKESGDNQSRSGEENRFQDLEENLSKNVGVPVLIKSGGKGGKIMIKFSNLEELNKIAKTILG